MTAEGQAFFVGQRNMRHNEKRPFYKPKPQKTSLLECVLAIIGALFMAAIFVAAVAAVRS